MTSDLLPRLRRFWWAPLLFITAMDLAAPLLTRLVATQSPALVHAIAWIPFGLYTAAQLGLLALVWPELPEGGPEQILLGCQAALPVLWNLAGFFWLRPVLGGYGSNMGFWLLWVFARSVASLAFLGAAFNFRRKRPDPGALTVAASTGLVILGAGWEGVGLGSLLALLWRDPLPFELCGEVDPEGAAGRASIAGFLMLLASPLIVLLPFLVWGRNDFRLAFAWVAGPSLVIGALSWTMMAARLGRSGKVWRVLTWVSLGLAPVLGIATVLILLSLSHGRLF